MGKKIREAREEAGLSQAELAKKIYRRRATVSDIENGKSEVGSLTLSRLSSVLEKPLSYFFPYFAVREHQPDEISPLSKELLLHFEILYDENLQQAVIQQVKALAEYNPTRSLKELLEFAKEDVAIDAKIEEYFERHRKRFKFFGKE